MAATYSFQAKIGSRGYHVFKETTWAHASVRDRVVVEVETNQTLINIAHIPVQFYVITIPLDIYREKFQGMFIFLSKLRVDQSTGTSCQLYIGHLPFLLVVWKYHYC